MECSIATLWRLLRPSALWFSTAMVLGALSSLSEGVGIALFIPILGGLHAGVSDAALPSTLERALPAFARNNVVWLALVVLSLICIKNLLLYSNRALGAWMDTLTGPELRDRIFDSLLSAPVSFWDRRDPGKVLDALANESWRAVQAFQILSGSIAYACAVAVFTGL